MKKNAGLGRGLSAILAEVEEAYNNDLNDHSGLVIELSIDKIKPNPFQPRKQFDESLLHELAQSIQEYGLLQPVIVYESAKEEDQYFLIAGERRLRASKILRKESIKAIVLDIKEAQLRELALVENIQREDLNPIDLAMAYKELIENHHLTHEELANRLSKSRTQISNTIRLLELDGSIQQALLNNQITQGHAKVLVTLDSAQQKLLLDSILGQKLSVHHTEQLVRNLKNKNQQEFIMTKASKNAIQQACDGFGYDFKISFSNNKFIVEFCNEKEVEKFVNLLKNIKV